VAITSASVVRDLTADLHHPQGGEGGGGGEGTSSVGHSRWVDGTSNQRIHASPVNGT